MVVDLGISQDNIDEDDEDFMLYLRAPSTGLGLGANPFATLTIIDDDGIAQGAPEDVIDYPELNGNVLLHLPLSPGTNKYSGFDWRLISGTGTAGVDTRHVVGRRRYSPFDSALDGEIRLPSFSVVDDSIYEGDEALTFQLFNPFNMAYSATDSQVVIDDLDAPPTLSVGDITVNEADATASFTVTKGGNATALDATVSYSVTAGTAAEGEDYSAASGQLTFAPNETTKQIDVPLLGDSTFEGNEQFSLTLSAPIDATLLDATGVATITENDPLPSIAIADATVNETDGTVNLTITRSGASAFGWGYTYATADGSAIAGDDYTTASSTVALAASATSSTLVLSINNDSAFELDQTFAVGLSAPTNVTISDNSATVTIVSEDASPALSIADASVNESGGTVDLTVTKTGLTDESASVAFATIAGSATAGDYTETTGTLTFTPAQSSRTITVSIADDSEYDPAEEFAVELSSPVRASLTDAIATVAIADNDPPAQPALTAIARQGAALTKDASVAWSVTFDRAVTGVDAADFALTGTATGATISGVTGGPAVYTVTAQTGAVDGSIGLQLLDDDSIVNISTPLGGAGNQGPLTTAGTDYGLDTTAPTSDVTLAAVQAGGPISVSFTASDSGAAGVAGVRVFALPPAGSWTDLGVQTSPYSFAASADGEYRFATVAEDALGNTEATPSGNAGSAILYNDAVNSAFELPVAIGGSILRFPMDSGIIVEIEITGNATAGSITVERLVAPSIPVSFDADELIGESLRITAAGLTTFTATVRWSYSQPNGLPSGQITRAYAFESGTLVDNVVAASDGSVITFTTVDHFSEWYAGTTTADVVDWSLLDQ